MSIRQIVEQLLIARQYSLSHSFMISERGKFYTTRFGRSDPSLTRQVILGFSISLPVWLSVGEEASGGREGKREIWNEIDQEDAFQFSTKCAVIALTPSNYSLNTYNTTCQLGTLV